MTFPYSDSEGLRVIALFKAALKVPNIYVSGKRHLVFVCGGDAAKKNLRSQFLEFARKKLPYLRPILAEDAYRDLLSSSSKPKFVDLTVFERLVAELSDCVIVFPESFGSAAELGFFVGKPKLAEKLLTANPIKYQADDSFLNLGPLAVINDKSSFKPNIFLQDVVPPNFSDVGKRLARYSKVPRRATFEHKAYGAYSLPEKFFAIFELLRHLRIIHIATLPLVIESVFDQRPYKEEVHRLISVLVGGKYIERAVIDPRFLVANSTDPILEVPKSAQLLVAANSYLLKHHPDIYSKAFAKKGKRGK